MASNVGKRLLPLLIALLVIFQLQLWLGRGSVPNVRQMERDLSEQLARNQQAKSRNEQLQAEVRDLKEGLEIVEEKARTELGMVKPNEIFVQVNK